MPTTTYFVACTALVLTLVLVGWGACRLRRRLLPEWSGSRARLAEVVIALAVVLTSVQLFGVVGGFRRAPVLVVCIAVALAMAALGSGRTERRPEDESSTARSSPSGRVEVVVAGLAVGLVGVQWATKVATTFSRGMTHVDTLWYHEPYAARFVQDGRLTGLLDRPDALHAYVAHNSELVHALFILPFGRDLLTPFLSLGWAVLAVLSAWSLGRRRGVGALCVLGAIVVLGLPTVAGTHPGQGSNDVAAAVLLLAAVALLFEGGLARVPVGLAAAAAGLALGTKFTVATPVALLTVGVVVLGLRRRRPDVVASWCIVLAVTGGFWFLRNWVVADNPLPWFDLHAGPLRFAAAVPDQSEAVADYITDGDVWREHYLPGLPRGLGRAWVLVLGLPLGAAAMSLLRRRPVLERLVGGMVLAGAAAYLFTPLTADGGGLAFVYNLRYLTPVLLVGFVAGAVRLESAPLPWRRAALALLAVIVVANASARHHERMPAWPVGHLGAALLACVVVLMVVGLAVSAGRRGSGALRALVTIAVVVAIAGGWVLQRHYFAHRYVDAGLPLDDVYAELADLQGERVGTAGFLDLYPLFGSDLSNRASRIGDPSVGSPVDRCRRWREALNAERYGYVVVSQETFVVSSLPQEWLADDPAASEIFRRGGTAVYRIDGALDPQACAATA